MEAVVAAEAALKKQKRERGLSRSTMSRGSAIAAMKKRADSVGTYAPGHCVFHREWPAVDPKRPMSGWRTAWRSLREAAAKGDEEKGIEPMPRLATFRYYDLRHQCITEMLEAGIPRASSARSPDTSTRP